MPLSVRSKRGRAAPSADTRGAVVLDVTSKGQEPWVRFSPFFPHGGIPIPFSPGSFAMSVEGIWQGLKVFRGADIDVAKFQASEMTGLKRTTRRYGEVLGHRAGIHGEELLGYVEARRKIYLPSYRWVLEHRVTDLVERLENLLENQDVILLDYETNDNLEDTRRPLSHAALIKRFLEGNWPDQVRS
jgi:hypothetical protein